MKEQDLARVGGECCKRGTGSTASGNALIPTRKRKTSARLRDALNVYVSLRDALPDVVRPRKMWESRVPARELIVFLREVGRANAAMTSIALEEHPDLFGVSFSVNDSYVEALESAPAAPAVDPHAGVTTE